MEEYNSKTIIPNEIWICLNGEFSADTCLTGSRTWGKGFFFHVSFPTHVKKDACYISHLELYIILLACRLWKKLQKEKGILSFGNNVTLVQVLSTRASDLEFSQTCLYEIRYHSKNSTSKSPGCIFQVLKTE